jgi:hypothetical protein
MWGVQRSYGASSIVSEWRVDVKVALEAAVKVSAHTHECPYSGLSEGVVEYRAGPVYPSSFPRTPLS